MALKSWHRAGLRRRAWPSPRPCAPPAPPPRAGRDRLDRLPVEPTWSYRNVFERTLSGTVRSLRMQLRRASGGFAACPASQPRALHSADGALTVIYTPAISADSARLWLRSARARAGAGPTRRGGGMPSRQASTRETPTDLPTTWQDWRWVRFVSPRPERPACFVDVQLRELDLRAAERSGLIHGDDRSGRRDRGCSAGVAVMLASASRAIRSKRWAGRQIEAAYYWSRAPRAGLGHRRPSTRPSPPGDGSVVVGETLGRLFAGRRRVFEWSDWSSDPATDGKACPACGKPRCWSGSCCRFVAFSSGSGVPGRSGGGDRARVRPAVGGGHRGLAEVIVGTVTGDAPWRST